MMEQKNNSENLLETYISEEEKEVILNLKNKGKNVEVIKKIRDLTNSNLKGSKKYFDSLETYGDVKDNKLDMVLNIIMGISFGVFAGLTLANYREYTQMPELYELRSAPWYYDGSLQGLLIFILVVTVCGLIKKLRSNKDKNL